MCEFFKKCSRWVKRPGFLLAMTLAVAAPGTTLAALLGNTLGLPHLAFDNQGTTNYTASTDQFLVDASPLAILLAGNPPVTITAVPGLGDAFIINITVDDTGTLTGGVPGDDLLVVGEVTLPSGDFFSGVLLTGEVSGFGHQDSGGTTDSYDFTFMVSGGQLAFLYPAEVGVALTSEQSNFTGNFTVDFAGEAKGTLGALAPDTAALGDRVWEDLNANGIQDCEDSNGNGILGDVDPLDPLNPNVSDQGKECGDSSSGGAGIAGVPVNLFQPDVNGDCTTDLNMQVMTGADGLYLFPDLVPGDYCVQFGQPPAGFCDTDGYKLGAPQFTAQNQGNDDAVDSDADPTDGTTEALTLGAGETNRTLDAGFVCPAKIGDLVWEDVDQDGLQNGEPVIGGVTVNLFDCGPDGVAGTGDDIDTGQSRVTDNVDGMYMFGAEPGVFDLPPGDYYVKFDPTSFPPDFDFTTPKVGDDDTIDSDCLPPNGITACVTLGSRDINLDRDCGLIPPPPPECGIGLDKKCRVEPQPTGDIAKCKGKLQQFTVVWAGSGPITVDSVNMGTTSASGTVKVGDEVIFFGPYSSNDVVVNISGTATGQSTFHVSCSDDDFNGTDDCGKLAGDGKNKAGFINEWRLEGFIDADGQVLDCTSDSDGEFAQNCTFTQPPLPSCDTVGKPTSLTFKYTGGACPGDNDQGSKSDCSGTVDGMEMATIAVNTADGYTVSPVAVDPDGLFTITRGGQEFKSNTDINLSNSGGTQLNDVHTSCSAPLAVGDEFGALTLVGINGQTGGVAVTYQYVVTNSGDSLFGVTVTDTILGHIAGPFDLASNDSQTFTETTSIDATTVNVGTASGDLADGSACSDSDQVIVEALGPPPCIVSGEPTIKLDKKKLEWKITNAGTQPAVIDRIEISWPNDINGFLDKVKVGKHEIVSDNQPGPSAVMTTFVGDPKHLKIDPGKTVTMKFEFEHNVSKTVSDYGILQIGFAEGCEVVFDPSNVPFVCKDAKPIDSLSMIWGGPDGVDVTSPTGEMVAGVVSGEEVTFSGLSGLGNDIVWEITGGVDGISTFHVSCSDEDMNGPEDCGKPQGDGKSNDRGLNLWLLEGMAGTNGIGLDCSALP